MHPDPYQDTPIRCLRKRRIDVRIHVTVLLRSRRNNSSLTRAQFSVAMNLSMLKMEGLDVDAAGPLCDAGAGPRQEMSVRDAAAGFHLGLDDFRNRCYKRTGIAELGPLGGEVLHDRTRGVLVGPLRGHFLALVFKGAPRIAPRHSDDAQKEENKTAGISADGKKKQAVHFAYHSSFRFAVPHGIQWAKHGRTVELLDNTLSLAVCFMTIKPNETALDSLKSTFR